MLTNSKALVHYGGALFHRTGPFCGSSLLAKVLDGASYWGAGRIAAHLLKPRDASGGDTHGGEIQHFMWPGMI
jgi:hypothetical protein